MTVDREGSGKGEALADHARHIAATGDRWFLTLATSLSRVGSWVGRGAAPPRPQPALPKVPRKRRIDILPATAAQSLLYDPPTTQTGGEGVPRARPEANGAPAGLHSAGVQPLLEALRHVLSEHTADGGKALKSDERFWTLVDLLTSLIGPDAASREVVKGLDATGRPATLVAPIEARDLEAAVIWKRKRKKTPSDSTIGKDGPSCTRTGSSRSCSE